MFSANENIMLRQHKRRIVNAIEATIPEDILDLGVNVMVMQVSCQDIGCVPLETAIIIVFPKSETELLPGLPQSAGGSYKTKILKPMAEVETPGDIFEALPPAFAGGLKSVQRIALQLRDVVLAQLTQVGGDDVALRRQLAAYLQGSLDEYVQHACVPPPVEEAYANDEYSAGGEFRAATTRFGPSDCDKNNIDCDSVGLYLCISTGGLHHQHHHNH
jgi:hypothetical protein